MKCQVCGRNRLKRNLFELKLPVSIVVDYYTGERTLFPKGTIICTFELRKLGYDCLSDNQKIEFKHSCWRREDGQRVL